MTRGAYQKLEIKQGQDEEILVLLFKTAPVPTTDGVTVTYTGGQAIDYTGMSFKCQFREKFGDTKIQAEIPASQWRVETRDFGPIGSYPCAVGTLPKLSTAAMTSEKGVYDIIATVDGKSRELLYGDYVLYLRVTE